MGPGVHVLLPPENAHLSGMILEAGCVPVIDATSSIPERVPDGAWVRIRPGRSAPGTGPVILAEDGAPLLDRPTWIETVVPRALPAGFAGLWLRGREAGALHGEVDGLELLSRVADPSKVILDAGLGPDTAAAAAAMGVAGIAVQGAILGCAEIGLPAPLRTALDRPDDEATVVVAGMRVGNAPTHAVLRRLAAGEDPWALTEGLWSGAELSEALWPVDQGLALARELADRHGGLSGILAAYRTALSGWPGAVRASTPAQSGRVVHSGTSLRAPGTIAGSGRGVGSGVLWQLARWSDRPIQASIPAALAVGGSVVTQGAFEQARATVLSNAPETAPDPAPEVAPEATPAAIREEASSMSQDASAPPAIAIIGIGALMPGASDGETFWQNIKAGVSSIAEVPPDRWNPDLYFDPDRETPDKSYTKIGGFIRDFRFDSKRFRIPPSVATQVDPVQQIALHAVYDALVDARLQTGRRDRVGRPFNRERTGVIFGNSLGGELKDAYALRLGWPEVREKIAASQAMADLDPDRREALLSDLEKAYKDGLPEIDEDSMPGELANVIAGRIANAFDLRGPNFTTDAACASSLAALQVSVKALQDRDIDMAITGGSDRSMNVPTYVKFCKIGALSPDHSSPFDASANGFVMGEGAGVLVLKRLADAVRDEDTIYAVIRGVGASSDGKGKGITAPNPIGQRLALERAYTQAGVDPATVDLIEAHGTSTIVGDAVELTTLSEYVGGGKRGDRGPMRVGSVKSMIGHLKSAAGAAAVIKAAKALHEGIYPPSLGFENPRENVDLDTVPLKVQTTTEAWPRPAGGLRRAGVSAFGFGGTNFHVVMEEYAGQILADAPAALPTQDQVLPAAPAVPRAPAAAVAPAAPVAAAPVVQVVERPLPEGLWATSAVDRAGLLRNLKALAEGRSAPFHPSDPFRIAAASDTIEERDKKLARAIKVVTKEQNPDLLRARSIYFEDVPVDGKVAFLFTGQGSQYLDMGLDLAEAYPIVKRTFEEADRILTPTLGRGITDIIALRDGEDRESKELQLRRTEFSQPATLTLDVAILRLLAGYGVFPDMVAGHSLGEYGAAVAAGIMTFEQALLAVSARGREMASIQLDDPGKMAGIATNIDVVEEVLAEVSGYVIAANKNCPSQTVIAGASDAVDEAVERFGARGITVYRLPVSHAFHSAIVAPASEPLKGVLRRLGLNAPQRPITTNVTAEYYPTGPGAVDTIIDTLATQISSAVEWTAQLERMYDDGARVFVECGPKRALTGFAVSILKRRPHRAYYTNHPKRGGVWAFRDALAGMLAAGMPVTSTAPDTIPDLFQTPEPRRATSEAVAAHLTLVEQEATPDVTEGILRIVASKTGYDVKELDLEFELEADLGIDTVKQAEIFAVVRETYGIPREEGFRFEQHRSLRSVIDWAASRMGSTRPAQAPVAPTPEASLSADAAIGDFVSTAARAGLDGGDADAFVKAVLPSIQGLLKTAFDAAKASTPQPAPQDLSTPVASPPQPSPVPASLVSGPGAWTRVVCTGASVGLPGPRGVFHDENLARILHGENTITHIGERVQGFMGLGLVRLVKDPETGQGEFVAVKDEDQVIRLAGQPGPFDLNEWGVPANLLRAYDIVTQLVIAAAYEALRDAGIPLQQVFRESASGKRIAAGWQLPEALRDETGIVFGSAFPGYDSLVDYLNTNGDDGEGRFDRRFLFKVLSMGHSQLAQLLGARGPNTAINAACASATQGISIAQDWIRVGRCKRVIVVSADNVTGEQLFKWIGGGFMAAGAASTHDVVEETALPFDARRHGLVLGMGANAVVLESHDVAVSRGVVPVAELLEATIVNSAYHGTRLHPTHIADTVRETVQRACATEGTTPEAMSRSALFMSHETYTPARGGSAQAEVDALRAAFGGAANRIIVTNTKGYTGHPMGAGIEDTVAVKALQYGIMPPVANYRDPDPALGGIRIARGEHERVTYALRLAAGFGSQLAFSVWKAVATDDDRVDASVRTAWLKRITGFDAVEEKVEKRTLRVVPADRDALLPVRPSVSPADVRDGRVVLEGLGQTATASIAPQAAVSTPAPAPPPAPAPAPAPVAGAPDRATMVAQVTALIAEKTGYDPSELEADFELEADLGIDTVKQAEIFGEIRDQHGLDRDDDFRLADYPTIEALAGWLVDAIAKQGGAAPAPAPAPAPTPAPAPAPTPAPAPAGPVDAAAMIAELTGLIAEKTGYDPSELEPDFELEADLGIDTVKQAEIFGEIRDQHGLDRDDDFRLADYPTIEALAGWLAAAIAKKAGAAHSASSEPAPEVSEPASTPEPAPAESAPPSSIEVDEAAMIAELTGLIAEKTGYDPSELEPDFELEADLGIDTVKQAEIFGEIRDQHGLDRDDDFRLADYPTIEALAGWLAAAIAKQGGASAPSEAAAPEPTPAPAPDPGPEPVVEPVEPSEPGPAPDAAGMIAELTDLIAEKTGYEPSELEPDFELEADLGIDTVKQAEIFGEIRDKHGLARDDDFRLADYPTIEALAGWLAAAIAASGGSAAAPPATDEEAPSAEASSQEAVDIAAPTTPTEVPSHRESPSTASLPESFRLRRPILVPAPAVPDTALSGLRVRVLGVSVLADAVRTALTEGGAALSETADCVVDLHHDVLETFRSARSMEGDRPSRWLAITRLGGLESSDVAMADALAEGSRAGFAKALGREWDETVARVVDIHPAEDDDAVVAAILAEVGITRGGTEVFRHGRIRRAVGYRVEDAPEAGRLEPGSVLLVTGGGRGICARVALEFARRSPLVVYLIGRGPIASEPLDLAAEKARIRNALKATGARVTPVEIERRLKPLRKSEEVRANVAALQAVGAVVHYVRTDMSDDDAVRSMIGEVRAAEGRLDVVIHGAGVEESRLIADKDESAFHRVYDGKAIGGRALVEAMPDDAVLVTMGSVAGRFGNAGQVDYSAANDGLARMGAARGQTLHLDWTAWDDVGMAVRGGMKRLLTDRGVDLLPADAGAGLLVDLVAASVTGELVVAGGLGGFLPPPEHPLLDSVDHEGDRTVARRSVDLDRDAWIEDHAIDGTPVLPGVIGLELMTATSLLAALGQAYAGAQDVRFSQPAKIYSGQPLEVEITAETPQDGKVGAVLTSQRTLRTGRVQRTEHFAATVIVGLMPEIEGLPAVMMPDESIGRDAIYARFFHGPRFQVLTEVQGVAADALLAEGVIDPSVIAEGLHTHPLVLEAAFQAAGLHTMITKGEMALPSRIDEVQILGEPKAGEAIQILVRHLGDGVYDVDVDAPLGPVLRMRGYRMSTLGPLSPGDRFEAPEWERPVVFPTPPVPASGASGVMARAQVGESHDGWLTDAEVRVLSARGTARRIADRIAGRIAAKRALSQLTGVGPLDIQVQTAESGEPVVLLPAGTRPARVTITHRDGVALALAVRVGRAGIDLERVEARPNSFAETWFSEQERALFGQDHRMWTVAWGAKEAVQKALGEGMAIAPADIEIRAITSDGRVEVALTGRAAERHAQFGGGAWRLTWRREDDEHVLVEARLVA